MLVLLGRHDTEVHEILLRSCLDRLLRSKIELVESRSIASRGPIKIEIRLLGGDILGLSLRCLRVSQIIQGGHILVHRYMLLLLLLPLHFFPDLLLHDGDVVAGDITLLGASETLSSSWLHGGLNILDLELLCCRG